MPIARKLFSPPVRPKFADPAVETYVANLERALISFADNVFDNDQYQNNLLGDGLLQTDADRGFQWLPTVAGTLTVAPLPISGYAAMAYDTTSVKLCVYDLAAGAWKKTAALT